jgi:hypothetical protein
MLQAVPVISPDLMMVNWTPQNIVWKKDGRDSLDLFVTVVGVSVDFPKLQWTAWGRSICHKLLLLSTSTTRRVIRVLRESSLVGKPK